VLVATRPIDFRKGAHSLAALASDVLKEDPFSGVVIVFRAKRGDRSKILVLDTSGPFRWPPVMAEPIISRSQSLRGKTSPFGHSSVRGINL
jgi:hypothetical protein